jgi:hypothetical protein
MGTLMTLSEFLTELSRTGIAVVVTDAALQPGDGWQEVIRTWDTQLRAELAFDPPVLSLVAAEWAGLRLYRGCQALVCRDMPPQDLHRYLAVPCPEKRAPAVDYSVDLLFRFLPDLVASAHRVEMSDPLLVELLALAQGWPLSSVGVAGVGEVDPSPFLDHPSLRQLYVDRILATGDTKRLRHEVVRSAVRTSLGAFPDLAPAITAALTSPS